MYAARRCRTSSHTIAPLPLYRAEPLEPRTLLANLHILDAYVADGNGAPLTSVAAGEVVYLQVEYQTTDLPAGSSYAIAFSINGDTFTHGAGLSGTRNWVIRWGTWLPESGLNFADVDLDADNDIVETTSADNGQFFSFTGVTFAPGFDKPMEGTQGISWLFNNYVDIDPRADICRDYTGGTYCYDGHNGWDWPVANFRQMDVGYDVYAAAAGTVVEAHDGEFDRNDESGIGASSNYVQIDHGGGWLTTYYHLRRDSVAVSVGQVIPAGFKLGLVGSSGNSTGPHLHWGVYYQNRQVEPAVAAAENLNFAVPYPTTNPSIIDSGIYDSNPSAADLKEGLDRQEYFLASGGQQVRYWIRTGGVDSNDDLSIDIFRPDGSLWNTLDIPNFGPYQSSTPEYFWTLPTPAPAGTWDVRTYINGILEDTQTFIVQQSATPQVRMLRGISYFVDGRTTPFDFGNIVLDS